MSAHSRIRAAEAEGPTVNLKWVAHQLGRSHRRPGGYSFPRLQRYLTLLIEQYGFPPPLPTLVSGRKGDPDRIETGVVAGSVWRRGAVEAWIEDWLPPAGAAALDARAEAAAAQDMDAAAGRLQLVGAGR